MHLDPNYYYVLAQTSAGGGGKSGADAFFESPIGQSIGNVLGAIAILVVLGTIIMAAGNIFKGKIGGALKIIFGGFLLAAFLWNPAMFAAGIGAMAELISKLFSSFDSIAG